MPNLAFWNLYRLGGSSANEKKWIIEAVLAQIFDDHQVDCVFLCEVTGNVTLGNAPVGKQLYQATRKQGQLAYSAFNNDMTAHDLEKATIQDFIDTFGTNPYKKGGGKFNRQSKRPVAYAGQFGGIHVYVYHANASAKASFLVAWVAESLRQDTGGKFVLVGDLNCNPQDFKTSIQLCTQDNQYHKNFQRKSGGMTHNARKNALTNTYDWALAGSSVGAVTVTIPDYRAAIMEMDFEDDPHSDHLPIVISW